MPARPTAPPLPTSQDEFLKCVTVMKEAEKGIIKSPPNCNLVFRKWLIDHVLPLILWMLGCANPADAMKGIPQKLLTMWAAAVWKSLPDDRRDFWTLVGQGVRVYHERLYPFYHTAEAKARRAEERRKKKAEKSKNAGSYSLGAQWSVRAAVRPAPYPSQPAHALPSYAIHPPNPFPIPGPSTPIDAYPTPLPTRRPFIHPAMYAAPPPPPPMAATPSFAIPPSFHPPNALPFSAPLPTPSSLVPPPSWPLPQQLLPSFSLPALPFPITSSIPTPAFPAAPAVFPFQSQSRVPPSGYPPVPSLHNPRGFGNPPRLPFELSNAPQAGPSRDMHSLLTDNRAAGFSTTFFGIDESNPLFRL